jgi:mannosyltransferase
MHTLREKEQQVNQRTPWIAGGLVLLAFVLRTYRVDYQELRGDEAFAVVLSAQPAQVIVSETIRTLDPHPPLEYLLLRGWMALAGDSEFAVRFPSAMAGTAAVALVYTLARRLFGRAAGVWAAALMVVNPFQVWYAQEARIYAFSTAMALATTLALWVALERGGWHRWVAYALLTTVHLYVHYYAFFLVLAQGLWFLALWRHHRRRFVPLVAAGIGILLLCLPWLASAWRVTMAYHDGGDSPTLPAMLLRCWRVFNLGETLPPPMAAPSLLVFAMLAVIGASWIVSMRKQAALLLGLWIAVPLAGGWFVSLRWPVFSERYLIAATPAFFLFLGGGATWLVGRRRWGWAALGLLGAVCLAGSLFSLRNYYSVPKYSRTAGWRQVAAHLDAYAGSNDVLIQNYPDPALTYYYRGGLPHRLVPSHDDGLPEDTMRALEGLASRYDHLWFLPYPSPDWDATGMAGQWLETNADRVEDVRLGNIQMQAYLPLRVSLAQMSPVEARLGEAILLRGYRLTGRPQPGGTLALTLYWEALAPPDGDYTVFAHLVGAADAILGQDDHPPQEGASPTSTWVSGQVLADYYEIFIPPDVPSGPAWLMVGMYDPLSGNRLPVTGPSDPFNRISLVELQITTAP